MSFKTSFQWFADFNTSTTGMQIVQFSAGGEIVRRRLAPMFGHYRKYKLGAIHVKFVPAATLPVDPTGLSYEEGEQTVDPRDMFNPGLVRNTNGEDVFVPDDTVLNSDFSDSLYYSTMLDKRWKKFRLQSGINLRAFPKFWGVANLRQNMYPGIVDNIPGIIAETPNILTGITGNSFPIYGGPRTGSLSSIRQDGSSPMALFQTGQKIPMGWMPTGASLRDEFGLLNGHTGDIVVDTVYDVTWTVGGDTDTIATFNSEDEATAYKVEMMNRPTATGTYAVASRNITLDNSTLDAGAVFAPVPEIPDLITMVLPRSRKTQFYYRVYVQEDVYFADPITSVNAIPDSSNEGYFAPLDVFTRSRLDSAGPAEPIQWDGAGGPPLNDAGTRNGGDGGNI